MRASSNISEATPNIFMYSFFYAILFSSSKFLQLSFLQSNVQPSRESLFLSSHSSKSSITPLPHFVLMHSSTPSDGLLLLSVSGIVQLSFLQSYAHPSPDTLFLSSHSSYLSILLPSPHIVFLL